MHLPITIIPPQSTCVPGWLGRFIFACALIILLSFFPFPTACSNEIADILSRVEALNISRKDYTLGKVLTDRQKETAGQNAIKEASPGTYKFRDKDLYVVAHKTTDRVLILYERYEPASREKVRELVGSLFIDFGEPTVMAHEKIIYWAFIEKGKLSQKEYRKAKAEKGELQILATVKLSSTVQISGEGGDEGGGSVYYIISSEPVLKLIQAQGD